MHRSEAQSSASIVARRLPLRWGVLSTEEEYGEDGEGKLERGWDAEGREATSPSTGTYLDTYHRTSLRP